MNDKPTVQDILVNPEKALDDAYNKGVDDCIKTLEEQVPQLWDRTDEAELLREYNGRVISILENLKTKEQ